MSVVINDFEVVVDQKKEAPRGGGDTEQSSKPPVSPLDIEDVLERRIKRENRLRAH